MKKSLIAIFLLILPATLVSAQEDGYVLNATHVQAALLYRFAQNFSISTAKTQSRDLTFCVVGDHSIGNILSEIISIGTISGKKAKVITLNKTSQLTSSCNLVFISSMIDEDLGSVVKSLEKMQVLSVSDIKDFADKGGTIEYVKKGDQVKYIVNMSSAKKSGIEISSQLVNYAEKVL